MHSTVAGLNAAAPGYRRVRIAPRPGTGVQDAGATLHTPHGQVSVDWKLDEDTLVVEIDIPQGVTAVVNLDGIDPLRTPGRPAHHDGAVPLSAGDCTTNQPAGRSGRLAAAHGADDQRG
ncbi:MAG: alpha-L-rhamnosidase C-terminal domain-containing protein [Jiangellaceae bacterium]